MVGNKKNMFESLKEYFENTPEDKIKKDWDETKHLDNVDITDEESINKEEIYTRADIIHAFTSGHHKALMGMEHADALKEFKRQENL